MYRTAGHTYGYEWFSHYRPQVMAKAKTFSRTKRITPQVKAIKEKLSSIRQRIAKLHDEERRYVQSLKSQCTHPVEMQELVTGGFEDEYGFCYGSSWYTLKCSYCNSELLDWEGKQGGEP